MLWFVTGCFGPTEWTDVHLDDACPAVTPYEGATVAGAEALERTACVRALAGLDEPSLDPTLDEAAQAHAVYMRTHDELGHIETAGEEGYTGDAVWDRIAAAGWTQDVGVSISEVVAHGVGPADAVDLWVDSVYHREPFTTPDWIAAGFGIEGHYSAMAFVAFYPQSADAAFVYPVNGQIGVPTTFDSDTESPDPAPDHGLVGYPITVTVGSVAAQSDVRLLRAELRGPSGAVDTLAMDPSSDDALTNMVAVVPVAPLEPSAAYDAELRVEWAGGTQDIAIHFETAP